MTEDRAEGLDLDALKAVAQAAAEDAGGPWFATGRGSYVAFDPPTVLKLIALAQHGQARPGVEPVDDSFASPSREPIGWFYENDNHPINFSREHPAETGHDQYAVNVREATVDKLIDTLYEAWEAADEARYQRVGPVPAADWRDIETAPRDGTHILVYPALLSEPLVASWKSGRGWLGVWRAAMTEAETPYAPTHWMPLPTPPAGVKLPVTEDAGTGDSQDAASAKPLGSPQILPSDAQSVRPDGGEEPNPTADSGES